MTVGIKCPDGLDLDDVFAITNTGGQSLGFLTPLGVDIGTRYEAGKSNIPNTMIRESNGIDIKDKLRGNLYGLFRPSGWAYNVGINCNDDWWLSWMENWEDTRMDATEVSGVLNDCIYRGVNSDNKYTMAVIAFNPYKDAEVALTYERTYHRIWHNSWCNITVSEIKSDAYLKGIVFHPSAGAGGGVQDVWKITGHFGGYGNIEYELAIGIDNDSNKPTTGTGPTSLTINGKVYTFYQG